MADTNISVGFYTDGKKDKAMVGLTVDNKNTGLSPQLARHLAVDLMLWADRIDPPKDNGENNETNSNQITCGILFPIHLCMGCNGIVEYLSNSCG